MESGSNLETHTQKMETTPNLTSRDSSAESPHTQRSESPSHLYSRDYSASTISASEGKSDSFMTSDDDTSFSTRTRTAEPMPVIRASTRRKCILLKLKDLINSSVQVFSQNDPITDYCTTLAGKMRELSPSDLGRFQRQVDEYINGYLCAPLSAVQTATNGQYRKLPQEVATNGQYILPQEAATNDLYIHEDHTYCKLTASVNPNDIEQC